MRLWKTSVKEPTLLFLHVPKAAGTTLSGLLQEKYYREKFYKPKIVYSMTSPEAVQSFKNMSLRRRGQFRLVQGHFPYGLQEYIPRPYVYITMLREPVERVISLYYYLYNTPGNYLYETLRSNEMTLEDFLRSGISKEPYNHQVGLLSGVEDVEWGAFSDQQYQQAELHMRDAFHVVGLSERFDETLILLNQVMKWGFSSNFFLFDNLNITSAKPPRAEIPPHVLSLIAEHNQLDSRLYEQAIRLFDERIENQGKRFRAELRLFRMLRDWWKRHPGEKAGLRRYTRRIDEILNYPVSNTR